MTHTDIQMTVTLDGERDQYMYHKPYLTQIVLAEREKEREKQRQSVESYQLHEVLQLPDVLWQTD